jgi:hypothetical protein
MITVSEEPTLDFDVTARAATEAFESKDVVFSPDRIKWLYERGFSQGATVVAAYDDEKKIGQIAIIRQTICCNGSYCTAGQLVDLWILKAYRSSQLVRRIYREVERLCLTQNVRFLVAMPNENSRLLNERVLKLKPALLLPVRAGIVIFGSRPRKLQYSGHVGGLTKQAAVKLFSDFATEPDEIGLRWDGDTLLERTSDPTRGYAAHATSDLLLISCSRKTHGVSYTLLCGFFTRSGALVTPSCVRQLVRAACRLWKHRIFVFVGVNKKLPTLPGIALSSRVRSPMLVQLRDIHDDAPAIRFDRFQLIDSDFA